MNTSPIEYTGSDSERIQAAVNAAAKSGGQVVIPARRPDAVAERDYWLLDRAVLLPDNTTLILENCRLKLSDHARDNILRSANCGIGIRAIRTLRNIHILGVGTVVLEGADRPRATGDCAKELAADWERVPNKPYQPISYGTDAGKPGENQKSDWRSIGVVLAHVEHFSIRNLIVKDAHSWGISLERCGFGAVRDIEFRAEGGRMIDGRFQIYLNQDGLDLRMGCHDIAIENITGQAGDDLVALTAIPMAGWRAGDLTGHMVSGTESTGSQDDVRNITIRNVRGSAGGHHLVRFLNTSGIKMYNILLDGAMDTTQAGSLPRAVVVVGDSNPGWGGVTPLGDTRGFIITNIQGKAQSLVEIRGSLADSIISNLINGNDKCEPVTYASGREYVRNVTVANAITLGR